MRFYDFLMLEGIGDLAEINKEITASVQANTTATPEKPASVSYSSFRAKEEADTAAAQAANKPAVENMPYTGGATTVNLPYSGTTTPSVKNLDTVNTATTQDAPTVDSRPALAKLQSGQTLTDDEKRSLNLAVSTPEPTNESDTVTHWRSGITAKKGTALYDTITKQNADRVDRDAAFADKPTEDPGPGNRWVWQERNRTWAKVYFGTSASGGTGGNNQGGNNQGGNNQTENTQTGTGDSQLKGIIDALNNQISTLQGQVSDLKSKPTMTGQITRRKTGGIVQTVSLFSDGSEQVTDEYKDFSARDSVMKMFENTGLGQNFLDSLMKSIDQVYSDNIAPTDAQILNSIYNSDAYKMRFAANEVIRKRMADGKGNPGDRLLSPAEYVRTEAAYKEIMSEAGLPAGFYDQPEDFTKFIAELGTSVAEVTERVNIAKQALQNSDASIKQALKDYYDLTESDMVAYLLDPEKAFEVVNSRFRYTTATAREMYTKAEVGGAALRAGMQGGVTEKFAEEITKAGKANLAEEAFQRSARQQEDYSRLLGLYGETAGQEDLARESLGLAGGAEVGIKTKKLASKERAKFATRSAIDKTSLTRTNKSDV